jgi:glycosyltransferase involved in cell wall biosynthesis
MVLFVGQLLPHKKPEFLIEAYYILCTYLMPGAKLMLVGNARLGRYRRALQSLVKELSLPGAVMTGHVSSGELASLYRRASVFATASEHEGFCVPVLEAMSFDVPVLARRFAAIPETVGTAGLLLHPDDPPSVAAEALAVLIEDQALRGEVVARGRERVDHFDVDESRAILMEHLLSLV